jgi:hypothetical protein
VCPRNEGWCEITGRRRRLESFSRLQHALNAPVHFVLFDKLASRDLVDAHLHLSLEPNILRKQALKGFLYQLVGASTGLGRESVELGLLLFTQNALTSYNFISS